MPSTITTWLLLLSLLFASLFNPALPAAEFGPERGTLILIGGGSERGAGILETFINRAGGPEANFVIVPTGNGSRTSDGQPKIYRDDEVLAVWRTRGLKHVQMLHTADRSMANNEEFVRSLREANAVWFEGENAHDLLDAYGGTRASREFAQVLLRGGVIAGNAAGAAALAAWFLNDDATEGGSPTRQESAIAGFGLLGGGVLDLQVNTRDRWDDLVPFVKKHPQLLGIGLSESTAIVVTGDRFEVIGKWSVAVHDRTLVTRPNEKPFHLLWPGDVFNAATREVEKRGNGATVPPPLTPTPTGATSSAKVDSPAPVSSARRYGLAQGTLVLVGGGSPRGTGIMERFVNYAGGVEAKIVVIPTANGNRGPDGQPLAYDEEKVLSAWKRQLGLKHVRMLHTHDRQVANTEDFVQPLREATGVWFDGGRQWNLVDSYLGTLAQRELEGVLQRGGVIGGTSAGATMLGDYLVRGAVAGPEIVMPPEPEHQHGFAFLPNSAVDQHINTRRRWDDLVPVVAKYPSLIGIGLSESTAIIVQGERFEVVGKWKVTVHDGANYTPWQKPYAVLSAGDVFNLRTRRLEKAGDRPVPIPALIGAQ